MLLRPSDHERLGADRPRRFFLNPSAPSRAPFLPRSNLCASRALRCSEGQRDRWGAGEALNFLKVPQEPARVRQVLDGLRLLHALEGLLAAAKLRF